MEDEDSNSDRERLTVPCSVSALSVSGRQDGQHQEESSEELEEEAGSAGQVGGDRYFSRNRSDQNLQNNCRGGS